VEAKQYGQKIHTLFRKRHTGVSESESSESSSLSLSSEASASAACRVVGRVAAAVLNHVSIEYRCHSTSNYRRRRQSFLIVIRLIHLKSTRRSLICSLIKLYLPISYIKEVILNTHLLLVCREILPFLTDDL